MAFSSIPFLCAFFPVAILLYYLTPSAKLKNCFLIVVSLLFYAYGEGIYVLLMLACVCFNYLLAILTERSKKGKKILLAVGVAANLGVLGIYKYAGMIVLTVNRVTGLRLSVPVIHLPIGISFFTFQALSYVIDVYRGKVKADRSLIRILLYISFFPQLIAGPIIKYHDISEQLDRRKLSAGRTCRGLRRFVVGLSKKVLISNTMGLAADYVFSLQYKELGMLLAWIGAVAYLFQIYFDFSGYSDMAIGMGHMFGFEFMENFRYPYVARSMQDFWRRWHISLSGWFREYLYIPLGGNRKGKTRTWVNRLLVFFFTGLWHGTNWTFVVWGLWHGLFLTVETVFPKMTKKMGVLRHVYVLLVVCTGFVIFRAESIGQAWMMLGVMFTKTAWTPAIAAATASVCDRLFLCMLPVAAVCSLPLVERIKSGKRCGAFWQAVSYPVSVLLLVACLVSLAGGTYNPFIYFRF